MIANAKRIVRGREKESAQYMKRRKEKGEEEKGKGKRGREEENNIFWKKLSSYITGGKKVRKV